MQKNRTALIGGDVRVIELVEAIHSFDESRLGSIVAKPPIHSPNDSSPPNNLNFRIPGGLRHSEKGLLGSWLEGSLSKTIDELNAALEPLGLRIPAWHTIAHGDDQRGNYWTRAIGYTWVENAWTIALNGHHQSISPGSTPLNSIPTEGRPGC